MHFRRNNNPHLINIKKEHEASGNAETRAEFLLIHDIYNKAGELLPDIGIDLVQIPLYYTRSLK